LWRLAETGEGRHNANCDDDDRSIHFLTSSDYCVAALA
jgi:hypothetical protein